MKEKLIKKPRKEDYGWHERTHIDDEPSGWFIEGGEEAYIQAVKDYKNQEHMKMTQVLEELKKTGTPFYGFPKKETEKAIGFGITNSNKIAWFPKSQCKVIVDDFYSDKIYNDSWFIPAKLVAKKITELGIFVHDLI